MLFDSINVALASSMSVLRWALQRRPGVEGPGSDRAAQYGVGAGGKEVRTSSCTGRPVRDVQGVGSNTKKNDRMLCA